MESGNKERLKKQAKETMEICEKGFVPLQMCGQINVPIAERLQWAKENTKLYEPLKLGRLPFLVAEMTTKFEVTGETTIEAGHRLWANPHVDIAVLNFASAVKPGGGFLNGAVAQEEDLARASGLYTCISQDKCKKMYLFNATNPNEGLYSDYMIYSPFVPVFRDKAGKLVAPYYLSFITAPACDLTMYQNEADDKVHQTMINRICKILRVALNRGHQVLVLGAFGCGVFGQKAENVARYFHTALHKPEFQNVFELVIFALGTENLRSHTMKVFKENFLSSNSGEKSK